MSETSIRAASEAAKNFIEPFYAAINDGRPIAPFYINTSALYTQAGHPPADLTINGLVMATPEDFEALLARQRPIPAQGGGPNSRPKTARYEVEAWDVHVINADYRFGAPSALLVPDPTKPDHGASLRQMLMVTVSGTLHLGDDDKLKQHFNDVFILVPNWDVLVKYGAKGHKRVLVQSQTYRAY
ncbi:hypothetical protein QBC47DRAFT_384152 [Echria macrotheca]|uniref:NTF2 domain-containing protein n=1 Tax=Echria macrotheca TaxID=438768 RepID=A0AAJ0F4E7_9PEZI|nr:hypothetical protein QBC47DRAFT_384152 [Echria macrotheca]